MSVIYPRWYPSTTWFVSPTLKQDVFIWLAVYYHNGQTASPSFQDTKICKIYYPEINYPSRLLHANWQGRTTFESQETTRIGFQFKYFECSNTSVSRRFDSRSRSLEASLIQYLENVRRVAWFVNPLVDNSNPPLQPPSGRLAGIPRQLPVKLQGWWASPMANSRLPLWSYILVKIQR